MTPRDIYKKLNVKVEEKTPEELANQPGNNPHNVAAYSPREDIIMVPTDFRENESHKDEIELHELVHWTGGSEERFPRLSMTIPFAFLPNFKAIEEVTAEKGAEKLAADLLHKDISADVQHYINLYSDGMPENILTEAEEIGEHAAEWIEEQIKKKEDDLSTT